MKEGESGGREWGVRECVGCVWVKESGALEGERLGHESGERVWAVEGQREWGDRECRVCESEWCIIG